MKTPKHSLRKIVTFLNDRDEDGGFWLPNIQRAFVWKEEQICRMFDSIMREYPIGTLLVWKTKAQIRMRKFIENFKEDLVNKLSDFDVPTDNKKKCLVLDGQQRLQSLFIGLHGSYEGRELHLHILSGELAAPDDVKYKFEFRETVPAEFPWVKFKDIVASGKNPLAIAQQIIKDAGRELNDAEQEKVAKHVDLVFQTFRTDDGIAYQELDSIENEGLYTECDVVEVFIRANSGGTKLGKSDLLFSLLASNWDEAGTEMEEILEQIRMCGFDLPRDFVLKTCLTILGKGASYDVSKFREPEVLKRIKQDWEGISAAIRDVIDFVREKTFIQTDKALTSNMVLIPLVYARYHYKSAWKSAKGRDRYLLRALLAGVFGTYADQLIDDSIAEINHCKGFDADALFEVIRSKDKILELTDDRLWQMGYGSKTVHLIFNLWYPRFNYTPAYENNVPQVDHIFPQSALKRIITLKKLQRNQLANCMLLTREENGGGGKRDILPEVWFADKKPEYLELHEIPKDPNLWKLDRFEVFIEERKKLIRHRLRDILTRDSRNASTTPVFVHEGESPRTIKTENSINDKPAVSPLKEFDGLSTASHQIDEDFRNTKPLAFELDGYVKAEVASWRELYVICTKALVERHPNFLDRVSLSGRLKPRGGRSYFSSDPTVMREPLRVTESVYAEGNVSANTIKYIIADLLDVFAIGNGAIRIYLRE